MDALAGNTIIPPNEIDFGEEQINIGNGSTSSVYKATWKTKNDEIKVAVKSYRRFVDKEIVILKGLDHKNIVKFYGVYNTKIARGIVMELASDGDLYQYLTTKRQESKAAGLPSRLPNSQFVQWSIDIASAVQYLHKKCITHKDIKSLNCLLSDDKENGLNVLKLCDFGIAKQADGMSTVMASIGGCTNRWAAPEVIKNPTLVCPKSDIYSLSVVLWEAWTCQYPWEGLEEFEMSMNIVNGILLGIPNDFPEVLRPMITKCWSKEREKRCNIDEVLDYLERFRDTLEVYDFEETREKSPDKISSVSDDREVVKTSDADPLYDDVFDPENTLGTEVIEQSSTGTSFGSDKEETNNSKISELITPVPKMAEYYDDDCLPLSGKLGEEMSKLYEYIQESYTNLKQVKEEFFDRKQALEGLTDGAIRHLMINIVEVEDLTSRLYTWFKTCKRRIPVVCGLITNIIDWYYLQPMMNFAVYSCVQMKVIESIRHCIDSTGSLTEHDDEDSTQSTLTFTDIPTILLKQANWLKKFQSIIQGVHGALAAEMAIEESIVNEFGQCSYKLKQIVDNCNEHEKRIINNMEDHSTSLVHKLIFTNEERKYIKAQKCMVYRESWIKKKGNVVDVRKGGKMQSTEERKLTMMVFVNTVLILQSSGDYLKVVDCIHKQDILFESKQDDSMGANYTSGEFLILIKLDSVCRHASQKYSLYFEDRTEIPEWSNVLKFSEEENTAQEVEYFTPLEILNKTNELSISQDQLTFGKEHEQNDRELKILLDINDLNKKNINSLSKLIQSYIRDDAVLRQIIEEGVKHHLYRNIIEVKDVIESFASKLESNRPDSFAYFTELNSRLKEDCFIPIIEYQANMCFQQNMLQFQRKHRTAFMEVLGNLKRKLQSKYCVSEMDLKLRLSKPAEWLIHLYRKSKALNDVLKGSVDQPHHHLQIDTIQRLENLIQKEQELLKSMKRDSHMTSVLLSLPIPSHDSQLIYKLSNIKDDWLKKHGRFTTYSRRKPAENNTLKNVMKRYSSSKIHIYASASVIIVTSDVTTNKQDCKCFDRNYADIEVVDVKLREHWMPEKSFLFKLWIYEKVDSGYNPVEYLLKLPESDQAEKDFEEWKSALVVATGDSGTYDDYARPRHIISEPFTTDRDNELQLDVNDFVEIIEYQQAINKAWVKGIRLRDGLSGWFPREILGPEAPSEYKIGQEIKLQYQKEREKEREDKGSYIDDSNQATSRRPRKFSFPFPTRKSSSNCSSDIIPVKSVAVVSPLDTSKEDVQTEVFVGDGYEQPMLVQPITSVCKDNSARSDAVVNKGTADRKDAEYREYVNFPICEDSREEAIYDEMNYEYIDSSFGNDSDDQYVNMAKEEIPHSLVLKRNSTKSNFKAPPLPPIPAVRNLKASMNDKTNSRNTADNDLNPNMDNLHPVSRKTSTKSNSDTPPHPPIPAVRKFKTTMNDKTNSTDTADNDYHKLQHFNINNFYPVSRKQSTESNSNTPPNSPIPAVRKCKTTINDKTDSKDKADNYQKLENPNMNNLYEVLKAGTSHDKKLNKYEKT